MDPMALGILSDRCAVQVDHCNVAAEIWEFMTDVWGQVGQKAMVMI